ncbi:MAG: PaaI family thioesterase [Paracoccus sp. (in: a-proteobacteria)]|uniref:PaaI family thioesterase n=1 Tax=Paracoccus sp. TaxID=267 RepID=UPI002E840F76|nr:PaaI family thioesterase [Pseudomonadota bacterium]
MTDTPLSPETLDRLRASFDAQGLMRHLGASIVAALPGHVTLRLPFRPELTQQHGYFHAGGTAALADSAGGYAAFTLFPPGHDVLTTEFKLNLLNPAQGDWLEAEGRVVKPGRTLTICQLDVWGIGGAHRTHVATGLQTLICIKPRDVTAPRR